MIKPLRHKDAEQSEPFFPVQKPYAHAHHASCTGLRTEKRFQWFQGSKAGDSVGVTVEVGKGRSLIRA
jgi:hypothetical protein